MLTAEGTNRLVDLSYLLLDDAEVASSKTEVTAVLDGQRGGEFEGGANE